MVTLKITFLAGQFHATPWGRNVNEGVPEWPPSPFRIFRAMYDSWKRKCPDIDESIVESTMGKMSSIAPCYVLPDHTTSHVRYYMSQNTKVAADKQKIFDAFVIVNPEDHLFMSWPDVKLDEGERTALARIVENLNFLGRSESWVSISVEDDAERKFNCVPIAEKGGAGIGYSVERVACASPKELFNPFPTPKGKKPIGWLETLAYSTADMLREGANTPPLLTHIDYSVPDETPMSSGTSNLKTGREINPRTASAWKMRSKR